MIELIALANIGLNIGLRFAFPYFVSRMLSLPWLNFVTLPLLASIPVELLRLVAGPLFLIDGGIAALSYQKWLLIENTSLAIGLIISLSIFHLVFSTQKLRTVAREGSKPNQSLMLTGIIFLSASVLGFVITAATGYGIVNWLISPRTGYQSYRDGVGPFYALMTSGLSIGAFFTLLGVRKSKTGFILTVLAMLPLAYLTGSKGILLSLFILAAQIYLFNFKRIPTLMLICAVLPTAGLMLIQFGSANFVEIFSYFDYYYNTTLIYDALSHNRLAFFNGYVSLSDFWGLVPRGLYPDKPYVYGSVVLSDLLYPGIAEEGHNVGFGGPIYAYADFGIFGILLSTLMNPIQWAIAVLYGFIARIILTSGAEAIRAEPKLVLILFFLIDYNALVFFAFPLNIVCFVLMWLILTLTGHVRFSMRQIDMKTSKLLNNGTTAAN